MTDAEILAAGQLVMFAVQVAVILFGLHVRKQARQHLADAIRTRNEAGEAYDKALAERREVIAYGNASIRALTTVKCPRCGYRRNDKEPEYNDVAN